MACANCGTKSPGDYCPTCGQRIDVDAKSIRYWLRTFGDEVLSLEGRLPTTLRALVLHPGLLTEDWLQGRRARWTHPIRLYLLTSVVYFTAVALSPEHFTTTTFTGPRAAVSTQALQLEGTTLEGILPQVVILLVPLSALLLKVGFDWKRLYSEHFVMALHLHAFLFLMLALAYGANNLPAAIGAPIFLVGLLWSIVYVVRSTRRVYSVGWLRAISVSALAVFVQSASVVRVAGQAAAVLAEDPLAAIRAAEATYRGVRAGNRSPHVAVVEFQQLPAYALTPHVLSHEAELLLLAGYPDEARRLASMVLAADSTFLLALGVAARAAEADGLPDVARTHWERLLGALAQRSADTAFVDHEVEIAELRERAMAAVEGGGIP